VFDETGAADTATPWEMFSKDMSQNSTGSRMTITLIVTEAHNSEAGLRVDPRRDRHRPKPLRLPGAATQPPCGMCRSRHTVAPSPAKYTALVKILPAKFRLVSGGILIPSVSLPDPHD
jgi:hypothetical protein